MTMADRRTMRCLNCTSIQPSALTAGPAAIFAEAALPEKWHNYIEINASYVVGGKFQPDKYQKTSS